MEFVAAGRCTVKYLRFYQTIRNLICGDLKIPLVGIRLGVTNVSRITIQEFDIRYKWLLMVSTSEFGSGDPGRKEKRPESRVKSQNEVS